MTGVTRGRIAAGVAVYGVAASAYLTWVHYSGTLALCIGVGGCETVQTSRYAEAGPVPVALVGIIGFVPMAALALWRLRADAPAWTLTGLFGLSLAGTLYVAYLTYLELFVIAAICPWCVSVALAVVALLLLTVMELRST